MSVFKIIKEYVEYFTQEEENKIDEYKRKLNDIDSEFRKKYGYTNSPEARNSPEVKKYKEVQNQMYEYIDKIKTKFNERAKDPNADKKYIIHK